MNQLTHWLDASNVYGSDDHEAKLLRSGSGGKLKVTNEGNEDMLPKCDKYPELMETAKNENDKKGLEVCHTEPPNCGKDCFAGGTYFQIPLASSNSLNIILILIMVVCGFKS